MINLIKNLFTIAKLLTTTDTEGLRFSTVSVLGKTQKVMMFSPYGLMHHPPNGSLVTLWGQGAMESNKIGMADDPKNRTLKNLSQGEVALGNYQTGNYIFFDKDGNCTIKADNVNVISGSLTHNGVNVGDNHVHSGVLPGPNNTGGPQ